MNVASPLAIVCTLLTSGLLACSEPAGPDDSDSSGSSTGTTGTTTTTTPTTGADTGNAPPAAECAVAGGICIEKGGCVKGGGSIAAASPGGCAFDDGPAECCVPPAAKPKPETCRDAGGLCAPIGGCLDAGGYFTSVTTGCEFSSTFACCVPHDRCGEQTIECCTDRAAFNPSCDNGAFVCMTGEPVPNGTCMPP